MPRWPQERTRLADGTFAPKHGDYGTKEYSTWGKILNRCLNPNDPNYFRYGGRGIGVCDDWRQYENFLRDIGRAPYPKATLDRIDNNRGYEPGNVRWVSHRENCNNRRSNLMLEYRGRTQSLAKWAREIGFNYRRVYCRVTKLGWSVERAFNDE